MKTYRNSTIILWITMAVIVVLIVFTILYFRSRILEIDNQLDDISAHLLNHIHN